MTEAVAKLVARAISPKSVRVDGLLTVPRSYGVFELSVRAASGVQRYRFGNCPVRGRELEQEYGSSKLLYLFRLREDAQQLAKLLNGRSA